MLAITSTVSTQAQTLVSHLHHLKLSPNARLPPLSCPLEPERSHLHHVYSSTNARLPPPSPQIEPECSLPPPSCPFEPARSPSTFTMSIQVQTLISHFHCVHSSLNAHLHLSLSARHHLHHVYSSANTHFPPPSPQIKPKCSSPTSVVSIGAQTPPPPPCPFKLERSPSASTMSI